MKSVIEMASVLTAALVLAVGVNAVSPNGIPWVGQWDTSVGVITAGTNGMPEETIREIHSPAEAKALFDNGLATFVDARSEVLYAAGHVAGAILLPVVQFEDRLDSFLDAVDMDRTIITYCSGRTCEDSHQLARLLMELGYADVRIMIDGYPTWQTEGYPIEP